MVEHLFSIVFIFNENKNHIQSINIVLEGRIGNGTNRSPRHDE